MIQVKYCGLGTVDDYLMAWKLGIQFAGFVCYAKSSRHIEAPEVAALLKTARSFAKKHRDFEGLVEPKTVGLFVDMDLEASVEAIKVANFDIIQLYKNELIDGIIDNLDEGDRPLWWAVHRISTQQEFADIPLSYARQKDRIFRSNNSQVGEQEDITQTQSAKHKSNMPSGLILDSYSATVFGGTGQQFNWAWLDTFAISMPYFIAGGIRVDNIEKLLTYRPYGVDISSGIEIEKGKKDHKLMKVMIEKIRSHDGLS